MGETPGMPRSGIHEWSDLHDPPFSQQRRERLPELSRRSRTSDRGDAPFAGSADSIVDSFRSVIKLILALVRQNVQNTLGLIST